MKSITIHLAIVIICRQFYMLGDQCVHVLRGDRLGLVFNTSVSPIYYGVKPFSFEAEIQKFPTVGDRLAFEHSLSAQFLATGFINVSEYYFSINQSINQANTFI